MIVAISEKTHPSENMSAERPRASPTATSGLQYISVLAVGPSVSVQDGSVIVREIPKSVRYT
jgi:hypothetical protein